MSDLDYTDAERLALVEDVRRALREVYQGAETQEVLALLDHLEDVGLRVTR